MFTPTARQVPPPIIIEDALAVLEGNAQLLATVVQMVLDQAAVDVAAIRSDVAGANSTALAASSHTFKGSLGAIGAWPAHQACSALNTLARSGRTAMYATGLANLEVELARLLPCLQAWLAGQNKNG